MYTHPLHKDSSLESLYGLCEQKALVNLVHLCTKHSFFSLFKVQREMKHALVLELFDVKDV